MKTIKFSKVHNYIVTSANRHKSMFCAFMFFQWLMLRQQIYQEEQAPIGGGNSTQFYTHYTQYQTQYANYPPPQWPPQPQEYPQNGYIATPVEQQYNQCNVHFGCVHSASR